MVPKVNLKNTSAHLIPEEVREATTDVVMVAFWRHVHLCYPNRSRVKVTSRDVPNMARLIHDLSLFRMADQQPLPEKMTFNIVSCYIGAEFRMVE